jgi:Protein of unknown function (DUF1573)
VKPIYAISAIICLLVPAIARAELKWDQTTIELNPAVTDKQAIGHFKYQNTGKEPVHLKSVKTSCGCTAAQSQKDQVGPGENGEITATFSIGDRTGLQVKTVTVETDDPAHPVTVLTLKANIAQVLELQPNFLYWGAGEEPKPKTVIAKAGKDLPVKNLDVVNANPQFEVKTEKGSGPGEFKISVWPKETKSAAATTLTVKTDYPKDSPKMFFITARVTGPPATAVAAPGSTPASAVPAVTAPPSGH